MSVAPKKAPKADDSGGWLTTYADMMTLLMTFFVLLFAMSTLDPVKLEQFGQSLGEHADAFYMDGRPNYTPYRKYSSIVFLNHDFEGGTLQFTKGSCDVISPETGKLVAFTAGLQDTVANKRTNFQLLIRPDGTTSDGDKDVWSFYDDGSADKA